MMTHHTKSGAYKAPQRNKQGHRDHMDHKLGEVPLQLANPAEAPFL